MKATKMRVSLALCALSVAGSLHAQTVAQSTGAVDIQSRTTNRMRLNATGSIGLAAHAGNNQGGAADMVFDAPTSPAPRPNAPAAANIVVGMGRMAQNYAGAEWANVNKFPNNVSPYHLTGRMEKSAAGAQQGISTRAIAIGGWTTTQGALGANSAALRGTAQVDTQGMNPPRGQAVAKVQDPWEIQVDEPTLLEELSVTLRDVSLAADPLGVAQIEVFGSLTSDDPMFPPQYLAYFHDVSGGSFTLSELTLLSLGGVPLNPGYTYTLHVDLTPAAESGGGCDSPGCIPDPEPTPWPSPSPTPWPTPFPTPYPSPYPSLF